MLYPILKHLVVVEISLEGKGVAAVYMALLSPEKLLYPPKWVTKIQKSSDLVLHCL